MGGQLVEGQWKTQDSFADEDGSFKRQATSFRNWIGEDLQGACDDKKCFALEKGRYHMYVSYACPWAHRALIFRRLKGLEDLIDVSVVHPYMLDDGWSFRSDFDGATGDPLYRLDYLRELYTKAKSDYTGKVTVPVIWDKKNETIVNNESAEIIRIFNTAFDDITGNKTDYYPSELREEIDEVNKRIYHDVNNGVYKAGFAETQDAYEKAVRPLFETLDWIEDRLGDQDYLVGNQLTEADIRLFTTLIRFDAVYYGHFKCNLKRICDYPNLGKYTARIYNMDAVKPTVHFDHIKNHYYYSHKSVNPHRIVPVGPENPVSAS